MFFVPLFWIISPYTATCRAFAVYGQSFFLQRARSGQATEIVIVAEIVRGIARRGDHINGNHIQIHFGVFILSHGYASSKYFLSCVRVLSCS